MLSKCNLTIMSYDNFEVRCDTTIENLGTFPHFHSFFEIMLIVSGSMHFIVEGIQYAIRTGDILLIHPNNFHHFSSTTPECKRYFLHISPAFLDSLLEHRPEIRECFELSHGKNRLFRVPHDRFLLLLHDCEKMQQLGEQRIQENKWFELCYLFDFLQLLTQLSVDNSKSGRCIIGNDVIEDERISRVLEYIDAHLVEPLTLDQISSHLYITKYYLSSLFRKSMGLSVYQYIIQKRLANAHNLLSNGEPVLKACYSSGFSDYSNFLRLFKREYGTLPKNVRIREPSLLEI